MSVGRRKAKREKGTGMSLHRFSVAPESCPVEALKVPEKDEDVRNLPGGVAPVLNEEQFHIFSSRRRRILHYAPGRHSCFFMLTGGLSVNSR